MTKYSIVSKEISHPVTGNVIATAVSAEISAAVEPDEFGISRARGFYELKDSTDTTIAFCRANVVLSMADWSGDMADLHAQVLTHLAVVVTE